MNVILGHNNYGKSRVRLLRVTRREQQHEVKDLTFSIQFEGDFEAAHIAGDNRKILPTDTMKNIGDGQGSPAPAAGYSWYAGI